MTLMTQHPVAARAASSYLTSETAIQALALAAPMIDQALDNRSIVGSGFLYVVVMDPSRTPADSAFEDAILAERAFGDRSRWDADYAAFARAKAALSWRIGRDSGAAQEAVPWLLQRGDTALAGGICRDGLVVAASGAFAVYDEVFAGIIALWLAALARQARAADTGSAVP